ncbi:hypothetical protein EHRUM1_08370 [Ehrlichia ruminantium]|uniref:Uncharacterized protein n=1 Tax=Ehrlichia ruminantium (strain Welgevonden) TaxID=254945 RepID=A0A0H3M6S9_EHRRW|nr:hypothetical protein EHRUM1_08370 [Ehrlichia ruminantium]CAI27328.1 Hypothetical protein ERWE_CDS_08340 [Ehrlichia ruminantium str. Welgevonden]
MYIVCLYIKVRIDDSTDVITYNSKKNMCKLQLTQKKNRSFIYLVNRYYHKSEYRLTTLSVQSYSKLEQLYNNIQ